MAFGVPESTIEEIKARTDIADLISSYGIQLRRSSGGYVACCPFHNEKTPSFHVQPDKGFYHCFGCGESGDCIKFVQKQEGMSFIEAVKKLAAGCGVTVEEKEDPDAGQRKRLLALHEQLADFFRRCLLQAKEAEPARAYLASRELPEAIVSQFKIGYAPLSAEAMRTWAKKYGFTDEDLVAAGVLLPPKSAGGSWFNRFGGRLMFTITDRQDRAIAFSGRILTNEKKKAKYVNSPETILFKKSNVLFALAHAAPNIVKSPGREAIVCEGQIDVIRCHACGFPVAVASQGTAFTEEHVRILKKCADSVVLVFDGDGAGQKAAIRTGGEFLAAGVPVRVATLPKGEDPDSFLRTKGPEAFQACLDAAVSVAHFQVSALLAGHEKPYNIRLVSDTSRAVLETIAKCTSAVMRATLIDEAATLLGVPSAALQEDFMKVLPAVKSRPAPPPKDVELNDEPFDETDGDGGTCPVASLVGEDAASPRVNPPPTTETAFCEFLKEHERNASLAPLVSEYVPDVILSHPFTKAFVKAWLEEITGGTDAIAALRESLPSEMCVWLDHLLLNEEKTGASELSPEKILQDFLRRLWMEAVRRRQGELPAASSPENDVVRLRYSTLIRKLQRGDWERVSALMRTAANVTREMPDCIPVLISTNGGT